MAHKNPHNYRRVSLLLPRSILIISLLVALLALFFAHLGRVTKNVAMEYNQLMTEAESSHSAMQDTPYTARQERQRVQKDMFFHRGGQRLHILLTAADAQLVLDHQDAHTYVVEQMQQVKCLMQEELYYLLPDGREALPQANGQLLLRSADEKDPASWLPLDAPGLKPMAVIRCIDADEAEYYYKDDRFVAHAVKITRYAVPGHQLLMNNQTKLLMKGTAEKVEFSLKGKEKDLNFKAHHLKSTFFDMSGINI